MTIFRHIVNSRRRAAKGIVGLGLALALAGCSSASSGLTTGSLLPGTAKPADPVSERALQVGAISARAAKCGYNFDPTMLKANYLAFEAGQENAAGGAAKAEKIFDMTRSSVAGKIGDPSEYCTEDKTAEIKSDLTRHLAGDFSPPKKKAEGGFLDALAAKQVTPFEPQKAFCPNGACY